MSFDLSGEDFIEIEFYYDQKGKCLEKLDDVNSLSEKKQKEYIRLWFKLKVLTWQLHNDLMWECTVIKKGNIKDVDWLELKEKRLVHTIIDWNLQDENGDKIEITEDHILRLPPPVAEMLIRIYDKKSFIDKEAEKQLVLDTFRYYNAQGHGGSYTSPPPAIIEVSLMEKFSWTPNDIAKIPYRKIQEIFLIMSQREKTQEALVEEQKMKRKK